LTENARVENKGKNTEGWLTPSKEHNINANITKCMRILFSIMEETMSSDYKVLFERTKKRVIFYMHSF